MIIKKLQSVHGGVFPGAAYNEKKVLEGVAELAGYANIDGNFLHTLRTLHGVGIDCSKGSLAFSASPFRDLWQHPLNAMAAASCPFLQGTGEEQGAAGQHSPRHDA